MAKAAEINGLDCEASVLQGARLVLRTRLAEMCALREQALDFSDIKGVHDMRVASRRLRSAVRDFLPFLPQDVPRQRLKALAAVLGDVRDQDVTIKMLDELRAKVEAEKVEDDVAAGIERFAEACRGRRERARTSLAEAINKQSLAALSEEFVSSLERETNLEPQSQASVLKNEGADNSQIDNSQSSALNFRQAGRQIILLRLTEVRQLSASLYRPFESQPLHRLRIAAKRLRYALELFAECWSDDLKEFAREVARLQKSLGELHDCDLLIEELGAQLSQRFRQTVENSSGGTPRADIHAPEHRAKVWLLQHFVKERTHHFRDALARWHEWEMNDFFSHLLAALETTTQGFHVDINR